MRKFIQLMFFIFCSSVIAQELIWFPMDSKWIGASSGTIHVRKFSEPRLLMSIIYENYYITFFPLDMKYEYFKKNTFLLGDLRIDERTGFRYYKILNSNFENHRLYILKGKDFLVLVNIYFSNGKEIIASGIDWTETLLSMEQMIQRRKKDLVDDLWFEWEYLDSGISKIISSSFLEETLNGKVVDYKPEYMINRISRLPDETEYGGPAFFDNFMRCWAEGVPGDGIGEWLQVEFTRPSDEIMILNGYVDFRNMSAYMHNNRLKKIRIESERPAFSIEYTLPDYVAYHSVPLPQKTTKVKITILEVYKGLKYSDTCVTAIALPQERSRSIEEEKREVLEYLKKNKVLDYLSQYKREQK